MNKHGLILLLILTGLHESNLPAQSYTRGRKNIGFAGGYGQAFTNTHQWAHTGNNTGNTFSFRVTRNVATYFYPSLNYYYHQHHFISAPSGAEPFSYALNYHGISPAVEIKIPLLHLYRRISCGGDGSIQDTFFSGGIEYMFHTGYRPQNGEVMRDNFAFHYGLGFLVSGAGRKKSKKAKDIYLNLFNKRLIGSSFSAENGSLQLYESWWGAEIQVMLFRTYKFSNM